MRETILAVLALSVVTTMSIGLMSASIKNSIVQVDRELEMYASAVGSQVMDYVSSRSFDQRSTPDRWIKMGAVDMDDSTQWALTSSFGMPVGVECNLYEPYKDTVPCDDVNDMHMDTMWQRVDHFVDFDADGDSLTVPFEINAQVFYADSSNPDSVLAVGTRTQFKRIVLNIRSVQHRLENRHDLQVTLQRMIAYNQVLADSRALAAIDVCDSGTTYHVDQTLVDVYVANGATVGTCP